jgi:outer membrane protein assembly factor BamB
MMRRAGPLALALVLGGCSWFGGPDVELPAALVDFEPAVAITEVWSADIGTGPDRQFLRLAPARQGDTFYTVDIKGRVRALAQEDGDHWRCRIRR